MKKVWLGALVFALGVALAAPAMAIDWSATGFIGTIAITGTNTPVKFSIDTPRSGINENDAFNSEYSYLRMRGRLKLTARASEDLYGVMYFEMNANPYGGSGAIAEWGPNGRAAGVGVKELFLDFKIPNIGIPVWLRVGRQAFAIRPVFFLLGEGTGISGRVKIEPVSIYMGYAKMHEGDKWLSDDWDLYMWDISVPVSNVKVGIFGAYQDAREGGIDLYTDQAIFQAPTFTTGDDYGDLHMWWIGAYLDGVFGPVKISVDFAYDGGEFDFDDPAVEDVDFQGWITRIVGSYKWNDLNFGLKFKYASGLDVEDFYKDVEWSGYLGPYTTLTRVPRRDLLVMEGGWNQKMLIGESTGMASTWEGLGGYWFVGPFIDWQALDWLKLRFQFAYIGDTVEDGDLLTIQVDPTTGELEDHDTIGWEFDVGATVNVYKNLVLNLGFGYLIAGDALDEQWLDWNTERVPIGDNVSVDDPWVAFAEIVYTF